MDYFSRTYPQARKLFIESAQAAGASIESFQNPNTGSDSEPLFTDVALEER